MTTSESRSIDVAIKACEELCKTYDRLADGRDGIAFSNLYVADGVFDRLGKVFSGRDAIAALVAERPADVVVVHDSRNIRISVAQDGRSATGMLELHHKRGTVGSDQFAEVRVAFRDEFVLTPEGWRFRKRQAVAIP